MSTEPSNPATPSSPPPPAAPAAPPPAPEGIRPPVAPPVAAAAPAAPRAPEAPSRPPVDMSAHDTPREEDVSEEDLQKELDEFEALLDQHLPGKEAPRVRGEVIEAPVVGIRGDQVLVDMGAKAEATIPLTDFPLVNGERQVPIGQVIKVVQVGRDNEGNTRLSHAEARAREAEGTIREAKEKQTPLKGRVTTTVKGGVIVDIGVSAFMPASQVDLFKIPDLTTLVGQEIEAYVIEYDQRRHRAVLSRRKFLVEQREKTRNEFLQSINVDDVLKGKVKSALDFGVFVDLGVIDGFIPREEVSYDRGTHPKDLLKPGDEVEAKVIKLDRDADKITLSRKRLTPDPWETLAGRYSVGQRVKGTVVAVQSYGAFVHLEEGVTGMVHASDVSWTPGRTKPSDFLTAGQEVEAVILELNTETKRMSLGVKQAQMDPWETAADKYKVGARVKGTITSMTNYGVFVKLDDYLEGMCHVSDLSWERRINHPKDILKNGQEVEAMVMKVDPAGRRISLGIKQTQESPIVQFQRAHPTGSLVTGKVTRFAPFGAFVDVGNGLEGLIHISQIDEKRVELPEKVLQQGEEVTCKVVKIEAKNGKISLSRKDAIKAVEREQIRSYMAKTNDKSSGVTFGDLLSQAKKDEAGE